LWFCCPAKLSVDRILADSASQGPFAVAVLVVLVTGRPSGAQFTEYLTIYCEIILSLS